MTVALKPKTDQEAFDHAVEYFHRVKNQCRSLRTKACVYDGPYNTHCVVGDMIVEIPKGFPNVPVSELRDEYKFDNTGISTLLLSDLQMVHDGYGFESGLQSEYWIVDGGLNLKGWKALYDVAEKFGLDATSITKHVPKEELVNA